MKINKSKRKLAQLLIEAGVTQFPEGANWAAQDKDDSSVWFQRCGDSPKRCSGNDYWDGCKEKSVRLSTLIPNWHQTVLSRDEFDQIVAAEKLPKHVNCRCALRSIPEPTAAPTLDQLLQDWRNADDYARRKQTEADEAAAMRDERWQAVQTRAGEFNVMVCMCEQASEQGLVITDWRDLRIGDEVECLGVNTCGYAYADERIGSSGRVIATEEPGISGQSVKVEFNDGECYWISGWRFIRRP